MRRTSAARISANSEQRGGFTLVETAIALVAASLFSAAVISAVSAMLRSAEISVRYRESSLWFDTLFARRQLGADPRQPPLPAPGWRLEVEQHEELDRRIFRYRFAPDTRPSLSQQLELTVINLSDPIGQ